MADTIYRRDPKNPRRLSAAENARLDAMTPEEIERNAENDVDNPPMNADELARVALARRVQHAREKTGLTQAAFAEHFHINVGRLRDLEQGRTRPDSAMIAYLAVITHEPAAVERALKKA